VRYVDPIEVVWTLAALPGLILWVANYLSAKKALRAVHLFGITDARLVIARYSVMKAGVMIGLSFVFVLIGVISMCRPANPDVPQWDWLRVILTGGLIGGPASISFLGWRWRRAEETILQMARNTRPPDPYPD
jgi:hypothetical protein